MHVGEVRIVRGVEEPAHDASGIQIMESMPEFIVRASRHGSRTVIRRLGGSL